MEQLEKLVSVTSSAAYMINVEDVKFVSQVVSKVWALVNDNDINFIGVMHNKVSQETKVKCMGQVYFNCHNQFKRRKSLLQKFFLFIPACFLVWAA